MLDKDSATMAAHAFVTSTLDCGNSLLYGLPKKKIRKIQLVQNAAARVVINAHLWNALPLELHTIKTLDRFKNKLKTHLFSQYYNT